LTDLAGALTQRATYRPYGERLGTQAVVEAKGYIDERHDDDTGLMYLNARYYDPAIGRFVSADPSDPTAAGVGVNRYAYAGNNPVLYLDATGLSSEFPRGWVDWCGLSCSAAAIPGGLAGIGAGLETLGVFETPGHNLHPGLTFTQLYTEENGPRGGQPDEPAYVTLDTVTLKVDYNSWRLSKVLIPFGCTGFAGACDQFNAGMAELRKQGIVLGAADALGSFLLDSNAITGTITKWFSPTGVRASYQIGIAGELAAGITKNTQRIPSATGTATYRVPDILDTTRKVIGDVKTVRYLTYSSQLKDTIAYGIQHGYRIEIWAAGNARISSPLARLHDAGVITILRFDP
jgi:RHS repeat-associated protein